MSTSSTAHDKGDNGALAVVEAVASSVWHPFGARMEGNGVRKSICMSSRFYYFVRNRTYM